ncbi:MAG: cobalamin-dependent protein [Magnetococcales bacterium]|nr:cobalamin-dependent protein [Magnetococcales bacterium]MBF0148987.1 cobalamin-dependent protein [Magnetococcales bacterium]MBF0603053.1 cobalamin-dependent protein [Magnetococcales bacterium]
MSKILLINPSYYNVYGSTQAGIANPVYPVLSLAVLGGAARIGGHEAAIMDLSYRSYDPEYVRAEILRLRPDVVGITATTPLINQMRDISFLVKDISKDILVVGGGIHASALPSETIRESALDMVVVGEGDRTVVDILDGKPAADIPGIYWRHDGEVVANGDRPLVEYLDELAMPSWDLYPIEEYEKRISKIMARHAPLITAEFSRGCIFKCDFCASKNSMGLGYRKKSPERCAEEVAYLMKLGYREFHLADDIFTSDNKWAIQVCEAIIRRNLNIAWTCSNGIRVESANLELFDVMKRAGCYRVHFGFESGNDEVLKAFGKSGRATLEEGIKAVALARKAGLETWGMYMFGLSSDTEKTMNDTIRYARRTKVDVMKFGMTVPFPGTPMFDMLREQGRIKTFNWDDYNVYNEANAIFDHPTLSSAMITKYYRKAYIDLYYKNPEYIFRNIWRGIRSGEFFWLVYYGIRFLWLLIHGSGEVGKENFRYKEQWEPLKIDPKTLRSCHPAPKASNSKWKQMPVPVMKVSAE